jgi:hypothetical protein
MRRLSNISDDTQFLNSQCHSHVRKTSYLVIVKYQMLIKKLNIIILFSVLKPSRTNKNSRPSINVCKGDLVTQQVS